MKVELLEDITEGGFLKVSPARRPTAKEQRNPNGTTTIVPERVGCPAIPWLKGAVVDMSEASAQKYIAAKKARAVT